MTMPNVLGKADGQASGENFNWDAGTEVDGIAVEIARVDLGGVDLNHSPVLGI